MKKEHEFRDYNFTDADLMQKVDGILMLLERDQAELAIYGVKPSTITQFRNENTVFKGIKSDKILKAEKSTKTGLKDLAADALKVATRSMRVRLASVYAENSLIYNEFGIGALEKLKDHDLFLSCRNISTKLEQYKAELVETGIDEAYITQYNTLVDDFDKSMDEQFNAGKARDLNTNARIAAGRALYKKLVMFTNFGKDYWYTRNEAKYNDYIIYEPVTNNFGILSGILTDEITNNPIIGAVVEVDETDFIVVTDAQGRFNFDKLAPGIYTLTISADGYNEFTKSEIIVKRNITTTENVKLKPIQN